MTTQSQGERERRTVTLAENLPAILDRFIKAVNQGDTDTVLGFFSENGVVDDWGRRMVGHDAIRQWSNREFTGAKGVMTVKEVKAVRQGLSVTADWHSQFYSGTSRFVFKLEGEQISEIRITSA